MSGTRNEMNGEGLSSGDSRMVMVVVAGVACCKVQLQLRNGVQRSPTRYPTKEEEDPCFKVHDGKAGFWGALRPFPENQGPRLLHGVSRGLRSTICMRTLMHLVFEVEGSRRSTFVKSLNVKRPEGLNGSIAKAKPQTTQSTDRQTRNKTGSSGHQR
ncbi:hypothetical protein B0T20DRAFT_127370 [Sordaria brevicollis]|uniref:Uncharacterized protein n=1 Tax=Sordaria brevicollis TaxID=83679 RepID=A0AAE0PL49_SORBR|nr:hypothetical protein B0T20DRAFT_127370 [Sordaria brevicollis]